ncbi:MAG: putative CRISPR-associated protein [Planctomycetes bacterium]|nr:putative CRISPR-associated protein [Planctomycetota bacterium]
MPTTFLCSTGTSAAKLVCPGARLAEWVAERGGAEQSAAEIFRSFAEFVPKGAALHEKLSAEIHSLAKMDLQSNDRVLLLASATADGYACALAVEMYLKRHWDGLSVVTDRIVGLQVHDASLFRKQGVVNFVRRCMREVNDYGRENVVLNPTGGFKALVPYTVLIGMLKRVPCRYIFEQSKTLLELPPLPVEFQRGPFEAYRDLFERMERDASIPVKDWDQQVPFEERPVLEPLIERHGAEITVSDVGFLFLEDVRSPTELVPFLSTRALSECLELAKLTNRDPFRFLQQVARAAHRGQIAAKHEHVNVGNGMRWLKPGNTTDRYLVSVEGWRLLVWRAVREDEVGKDYPSRILVDPRHERDRYTPFIRMELWS